MGPPSRYLKFINSYPQSSISLLSQQVKCATKHIDIRLHVVEEKIQDHTVGLEYVSTKKSLRIHLQKAYRPMCSENTESTWVYGRPYDSWIARAQLRFCFKIERCIVAVNLMVPTVMTRHARYTNLQWNKLS